MSLLNYTLWCCIQAIACLQKLSYPAGQLLAALVLRLHAAGQQWPASHITAGLLSGAYVRTRQHSQASLAAAVKRYRTQLLCCGETLDRFQGCLIGTNQLTCVSLEFGSKCAAILAARSILALSDILVLGSRRNLSKRCCCCWANIVADVATRDELRIQARRGSFGRLPFGKNHSMREHVTQS